MDRWMDRWMEEHCPVALSCTRLSFQTHAYMQACQAASTTASRQAGLLQVGGWVGQHQASKNQTPCQQGHNRTNWLAVSCGGSQSVSGSPPMPASFISRCMCVQVVSASQRGLRSRGRSERWPAQHGWRSELYSSIS